MRAEKILQERLFRNPKIDVIWDSVVEEILGVREPPTVTGVRLRNVRTGACRELRCDGVFIAIGHTPVTGFVAGQLPLDPEGYVVTRPDSTETAIPGRLCRGRRQGQNLSARRLPPPGWAAWRRSRRRSFSRQQEEAAIVRAAE